MNKFAADGLIREAIKGRIIIVVTGIPIGTKAALDEFASHLEHAAEIVTITRVNGSGSIRFVDGGRIEVRTYPIDVRGIAADVIYLDSDISHDITHAEIEHHLMPALKSVTRGALVRA